MTIEEIVSEIQNGNQDKICDLWERTKGFVHTCAIEFHAGDQEEDLIQEGFFGILDALKKYDGTKGYKFLSYASHYIKNSMRRYLIKTKPGVRLPEYLSEKVRKYNKFVSEYVQKYGREPTDLEASIMLHMPDIEKVKAAALDPTSLDKEMSEDGGSLGEVYAVSEDSAEGVINKIFQKQLSRDLWGTVDKLPEGQRESVIEYYRNGKTYSEVAHDLHVSDEHVRQLLRKAKRRLRSDKTILAYREELYGRALSGGSLRRFMDTWTSSTERVALWELDSIPLVISVKGSCNRES